MEFDGAHSLSFDNAEVALRKGIEPLLHKVYSLAAHPLFLLLMRNSASQTGSEVEKGYQGIQLQQKVCVWERERMGVFLACSSAHARTHSHTDIHRREGNQRRNKEPTTVIIYNIRYTATNGRSECFAHIMVNRPAKWYCGTKRYVSRNGWVEGVPVEGK